jgi:hypothetical protein
MGFAMAQTGGLPGTSGGASNTGQCWDVSSNQVRSKSAGSSTSTSSNNMGSSSSPGSGYFGLGFVEWVRQRPSGWNAELLIHVPQTWGLTVTHVLPFIPQFFRRSRSAE